MKKILVAGATGYLGRYVVRELKEQGYYVRALVRDVAGLGDLSDIVDETFLGEVTQAETLKGSCQGMDAVISSVGITRQKDGLTYEDVDFGGNRNLLEEAKKEGIGSFVYVSVINAHLAPNIKIIKAKERFVDLLVQSGLDYTVIRPTGFFSDMLEFLEMARKGRVHLFGNGRNRMNPIHGADLAQVCVNALKDSKKVITVGGPDVFSYREIGDMAFQVLGKPPRSSFLPRPFVILSLFLVRIFTSPRVYGPFEFMATVMTMDNIGNPFGQRRLLAIFQAVAHKKGEGYEQSQS